MAVAAPTYVVLRGITAGLFLIVILEYLVEALGYSVFETLPRWARQLITLSKRLFFKIGTLFARLTQPTPDRIIDDSTARSSESEQQGLAHLRDALFTDFKIICGSHTLSVHKLTLAVASPYFRACTTQPFREALTGTLILGQKPRIVAAVLFGIYVGKLPTTSADIENFEDTFPSLLPSRQLEKLEVSEAHIAKFTAKIFSVADALLVDQVKTVAQQVLLDIVRQNLHHVHDFMPSDIDQIINDLPVEADAIYSINAMIGRELQSSLTFMLVQAENSFEAG
jgi:hypothetical protein